jgi:hypothetical protein
MSGGEALPNSNETQNLTQFEYPAYRQMRKLSRARLVAPHLSPTFPQNLGSRNPGNLGRKPNLLVTSLFA